MQKTSMLEKMQVLPYQKDSIGLLDFHYFEMIIYVIKNTNIIFYPLKTT